MLIGLLIAVGAMCLSTTGALLAAAASRRVTRRRPIVTQPRYLGGLVIDLTSWLFAVAALRYLPVFAVQAVVGGSIACTAVVGSRITGARLGRVTRLAVGACVAGLALVALSAGGKAPPAGSGAVDAILIGAVLVLGVVVLLLRQYRHAWPLAAVSGLGFGGTSLAVRAAHVEVGSGLSPALLLGRPSTYLVVGFWAVGIIGYSSALSRSDVGSILAVYTVTAVVVPGLIGIGLLGDTVRGGWGWPFVAGLAVAVAGVVVLTRQAPAEGARPG